MTRLFAASLLKELEGSKLSSPSFGIHRAHAAKTSILDQVCPAQRGADSAQTAAAQGSSLARAGQAEERLRSLCKPFVSRRDWLDPRKSVRLPHVSNSWRAARARRLRAERRSLPTRARHAFVREFWLGFPPTHDKLLRALPRRSGRIHHEGRLVDRLRG